MNGDNLAVRVRNILRDNTSATKLGQFWDDEEIRLALNNAQDVFINFALKNNLGYLLKNLLTSVTLLDPTANPAQLPQDYMHHCNAVVYEGIYEEGIPSYMAQIHTGGDADNYMWVNHANASIINNNLYFRMNDSWASGMLLYYRYPSFIGLTSLGDNTRPDFNTVDFENDIYENVICVHAAVILGYKETRNKRNVLLSREFYPDVLNIPTNIERYAPGIEKKQGELAEIQMKIAQQMEQKYGR